MPSKAKETALFRKRIKEESLYKIKY